MAGLVVTVIALLVAVAMVVRLPMEATALTCEDVKSNLLPCLNYIRSGGDVPSDCCDGLINLVNAARTADDRRAACNCEKSYAQGASNDELDRIVALPDKCGVSLPYNFSRSIDCSQVN